VISRYFRSSFEACRFIDVIRRPPDAGIADSEHTFTEQAPLAENCCAFAILAGSTCRFSCVGRAPQADAERLQSVPHLSQEPLRPRLWLTCAKFERFFGKILPGRNWGSDSAGERSLGNVVLPENHIRA
jgi:hypothetical protein